MHKHGKKIGEGAYGGVYLDKTDTNLVLKVERAVRPLE
jgi:hypothetical protein